MTQANETARPWTLGKRVFHMGVNCREVFSENAGGKWGGGYIGAFAEADAELIVIAVNERDALLHEVVQLREMASKALTYLEDTGESCGTTELIVELRTALAAKEKVTVMASEFATEHGHKTARLLKYYEGPPYNIPELLDAELQEVRKVLNSLRQSRDCWCVATWKDAHDGRCQRARALMEKLVVPEVRP
jgi:hypothetical protein